MGFTNTLLAILFFTLLLNYNINVVQSQEESTSFTFDSFQSQPGDQLIYQGDAHVPPSSTSLRLTGNDNVTGAPLQNRAGRVMYSTPVYFWEPWVRQSSFETTIKFTITPVDDQPAEGLTFFIGPRSTGSQDNLTIAAGPNMGIFTGDIMYHDRYVFAVEFDINTKDQPWDPSYPHIGLDFTWNQSPITTPFENALGQVVTARINYEATTKRIDVVATTATQTYRLSFIYDLKNILTPYVLVGISGSTGDGVSNLDIHSWYFSSTLVADPRSDEQKSEEETYIRQYV